MSEIQVLHAIRVAGFNGDNARFRELTTKYRVRVKSAARFWFAGVGARNNGRQCPTE